MSKWLALVNSLVTNGVLKNDRLIKSFKAIDRADFLPGDVAHLAHLNEAIPIDYGQTNSQPFTVALMLELLEPQPGNSVLDVGSGSGWTTAVLAHVVGQHGKVIGLERIPELVEMGQQNLSKYDLPQASIKQATKDLGLPGKQFDRILVSASAARLPEALVDQLRHGGILVIPVKNSIWKIEKKHDGKLEKTEFPGFAFVPLISVIA